MPPLLALLEIPAPDGVPEYAIASVVIIAVGVLRFAEALLSRYLPPKGGAVPDARANQDRGEIHRIGSTVRELHEWHKPDAGGNQSWKNGQSIELLKAIRDALIRMENADRAREERDRDRERDDRRRD